MSLFDFFKEKKNPPTVLQSGGLAKIRSFWRGKKKPGKKKIEKKVSPPTDGKKKKAEARPLPKAKPRKEAPGIAYRVLGAPHVTEKATALIEENKYVFKVFPRTNKVEIKKAVEDLYGVDVIRVRIINVPKRQRRLGKQKGWRKGYKKAIVEIRKGQKIEILPR